MANKDKSEIAKTESDAEDSPKIDEELDSVSVSESEPDDTDIAIAEEIEPEDPMDLQDDDLETVDLNDEPTDAPDVSLVEDVIEEVVPATPQGSNDSPPPSAPAPVEQKKSGGFFPVVLGGVIAAGLGFGVATYLMPSEDGTQQAAIETALSAQNQTIESLKAEIAKLAEMPQAEPAPDLTDALASLQAEIGTQISSISEQVTTLSEGLSGFETRLIEAEKRPIAESEGAAAAVAAYERELESLRTVLNEQQTTMEGLSDKAMAEVEAAEAAAQAREAEAAEIAAAAKTRAALVSLTAALQNGDPFEAAVAELQESAAQPVPEDLIAAAPNGIATLVSLQQDYPAAARGALAVTVRAENAENTTDRVVNFLRNQTGARSLTPREGNDPDAVLSRVEAAVTSGDLETALAEIDALSPEGKEAMAAWISAAETRAKTVETARAFAQSLDVN